MTITAALGPGIRNALFAMVIVCGRSMPGCCAPKFSVSGSSIT
jgi:hypothetical protein